MTVLDQLEAWLTAHRPVLSRAGDVTFSRGPADRSNPSAHLSVEGPGGSYELLLWSSGEAELNRMVDGTVALEHVQLDGPADLPALLERFTAAVEGRGD